MLLFFFASGRLAQRESTAFTRRGSLVRTQYRPPDELTRQRAHPLAFFVSHAFPVRDGSTRISQTANHPQTCGLTTCLQRLQARRVTRRHSGPCNASKMSSTHTFAKYHPKTCRQVTRLQTDSLHASRPGEQSAIHHDERYDRAPVPKIRDCRSRKKKTSREKRLVESAGSPGRTRTYNNSINSRGLCH